MSKNLSKIQNLDAGYWLPIIFYPVFIIIWQRKLLKIPRKMYKSQKIIITATYLPISKFASVKICSMLLITMRLP